jgi:hypothetical protein
LLPRIATPVTKSTARPASSPKHCLPTTTHDVLDGAGNDATNQWHVRSLGTALLILARADLKLAMPVLWMQDYVIDEEGMVLIVSGEKFDRVMQSHPAPSL